MNSTLLFALAVFTSAVLIQSASGQGKDGDKTVDEKAIKGLYEPTFVPVPGLSVPVTVSSTASCAGTLTV